MFRRPWFSCSAALVVPLLAARRPARRQSRPRAGGRGRRGVERERLRDLPRQGGRPGLHQQQARRARPELRATATKTWAITSGPSRAARPTGPVPSLKKLTANQLNATCLKCHEKAGQANYLASKHARRNVACTDCHGIHEYKSVRAQLKTQLDPETCAGCHKPERSKMMKTSHHPVREGKMSCASCHNPHDGAQPKMLKADSVNELCYKCHAEKRGPFLFEHAPVREDCASCHEPHGTNHKRLLAQKLPNLCWNCHLTGSGHFGSGDNLSTELGARVAPSGRADRLSRRPTRGSWRRAARTATRTCTAPTRPRAPTSSGNPMKRALTVTALLAMGFLMATPPASAQFALAGSTTRRFNCASTGTGTTGGQLTVGPWAPTTSTRRSSPSTGTSPRASRSPASTCSRTTARSTSTCSATTCGRRTSATTVRSTPRPSICRSTTTRRRTTWATTPTRSWPRCPRASGR